MKRILLTILLSLFFVTNSHGASMTINTLIPSPVGQFDILQVGMIEFTGAYGPADACSNPSSLVVQGENIYICSSGILSPYYNIWRESGSAVYLNNLGRKVAIGTSAAELKLDVNGGIIARGTFGSGDTITTSGAGTKMFWYPRKAAFRAGGVDSSQWDDANIGNYSVAFGQNNEVPAQTSSILGGTGNIIDTDQVDSVIVAGKNSRWGDNNGTVVGHNFMGACDNCFGDGTGNFIGAGKDHSMPASGYNTIVGGEDNDIIGITGWMTIGGGTGNSGGGLSGVTIAGGQNNRAEGGLGFATIGGGYTNRILAGPSHSSTIAGGENNTIRGAVSTIAGGQDNNIGGAWNFIGGGSLNDASGGGGYNTLAGGQSNEARGSAYGAVTVAGGRDNVAANDYATVSGGYLNTADGFYSAVVGGQSNTATGTHSTATGQGNSALGDHSFVGGNGNTASATADRSFVWGNGVTVTQADAFVVGTGNAGFGTVSPSHTVHINNVLRLEATVAPPACNAVGLLYVEDVAGDLCYCSDGSGTWKALTALGGNCNL